MLVGVAKRQPATNQELLLEYCPPITFSHTMQGFTTMDPSYQEHEEQQGGNWIDDGVLDAVATSAQVSQQVNNPGATNTTKSSWLRITQGGEEEELQNQQEYSNMQQPPQYYYHYQQQPAIPQATDDVDVEAVALGKEFSGVEKGKVVVHFGYDIALALEVDDVIQSKTWGQVKEIARNDLNVLECFDKPDELSGNDFALVLLNGRGGENILIHHGSPMGSQRINVSEFQGRTIDVVLLYAPEIHICVFDGLLISIPMLGHWLYVHDVKGQARLLGRPANQGNPASVLATADQSMNDLLLRPENDMIFCHFLARLNKFVGGELHLNAEDYTISIPFGEWCNYIQTHELYACVQLANPQIYNSLLVHFEDRLKRPQIFDPKRLQYIEYQRRTWNAIRIGNYRRWAKLDEPAVRHECDSLLYRTLRVAATLPPDFSFDGTQMQIHHAMPESLDHMHGGSMGGISNSLRVVVNKLQSFANTFRLTDFHIIIGGRFSHLVLPPKRFMQLLASFSGSANMAQHWGKQFLDTIQIPENFYPRVLAESSGSGFCNVNTLMQAGMNGLPPTILRSLEERNKAERQSLHVKGFVVSPQLGPFSSTQSTTSTAASSTDSSHSSPQLSSYHEDKDNDSWRSKFAWKEHKTQTPDTQETSGSYAFHHLHRMPPASARQRPRNPNFHSTFKFHQRQNLQIQRTGMPVPPHNQDSQPSKTLGPSKQSSGNPEKTSVPGHGYICRICGLPGGLPNSHWFQQCPEAEDFVDAVGSSGKHPPGRGYICKICGQEGGVPGAHWVQQCPLSDSSNAKTHQKARQNSPLMTATPSPPPFTSETSSWSSISHQ